MAVEYCAVTDVQRMLAVATPYSGSTNPTTTQVESFINEAEDTIDQQTQHAWRTVTVSNEFYDFPTQVSTYARGLSGSRGGINGIPIHLRHRKITTFASGTDKLEVWDGSSYVDWIATKTEGRADDFWIDQEQGILYIRYYYPYFIKKAIRLTYRYGESTVPNDIQQATAMMAAIKIIMSDDRSHNVIETGDPTRQNYDQRISKWQADINRILRNRTELFVV